MPIAAAIPLISSIGGAAIGALGGRGKQGSQETTSTQKGTQTLTPNEAGYFSEGRQGLAQTFQDFLKQSQAPVYGQAAKASVFNDLNDLAMDSITKLRGQLGSRGNSGFADSAAAGIERERFGGLADFLTKLPGMESQTRFDRTSKLLDSGFNFFGRAPVGQTTSTDMTSTGNQAAFGQPFGGGFASGLGGLLGYGASTGRDTLGLGGLSSLFGRGAGTGDGWNFVKGYGG